MTTTQKLIKAGAIFLALTLIINIFSLIINFIMGITNIFSNDKEINFSKNYDYIESIEIEAISSSIIIKSGTEYKVEATNVDEDFKVDLKNNILTIEENTSWVGTNNTNSKVIITVRENTTLKELSIDTGAGKYEIDNIKANVLDLAQGAGILEISNSYFSNTDIDGGAGNIKITNSTLNDLDLDSGVGKVELEATITGKSQISCGVGETNINLLGTKDDYTINVNKGIGSIKINDITYDNGTVYGSGLNKIKIDGGIGSINIVVTENTLKH